jgi:D-alanine--D-alanine ligase
VVLTNLELDHVDYHGSWENLRDSVVRFAARVPPKGSLIWCCADPGAKEVARLAFQQRPEMDLVGYGTMDLDLELTPRNIEWKKLNLSGEHNLANAAGALVAAVQTGASPELAWRGIAAFGGAERRLQILDDGPIAVIDDYAHHPTEIEASLRALRDRYHGRRIVVVYQPHLYSRTEPLIKEFAEALSLADEVVVTDIYPAREDPIPGVSSSRIAELVTKPVTYVPSRHLLPIKVGRMLREGDVVVGMGAGSIADFAPALIHELGRSASQRPSSPAPQAPDEKAPSPRVAVLYGGDSAEREVSILSGRAVHGALLARGYTSRMVDMAELLLSRGDLGSFIGPDRPEVAFLAVHGTHAEDGAIQGLLELLHIPYTGSGIQASAIAMDKQLTKAILKDRGLRVPEGVLLTSRDQPCNLPPPVVVKPNAQGSTVGLSFVETEADLQMAISRAFAYDDAVLVEEWVRGMEISVPVIGDWALPAVEICPASGQYDFAAKYTPGATEEICPARLPQDALDEAKRLALAAHSALGCRGATRTDIMVRLSDDGEAKSQMPKVEEFFILEVNTLPGLTGTSLLPNSARAAGISFEDLVEWIVKDALERHAPKA